MANKLIWKWRFGPADAADGATRLGFLYIPEAAANNQVAIGDAQWPRIGMRLASGLGLNARDYAPHVVLPPVLNSIGPTSAEEAIAFTLTCTGSNFAADSVIRISGVAQATTFVSATSLTCNYTGTVGNKTVVVRNIDGQDSAGQTLTITSTP